MLSFFLEILVRIDILILIKRKMSKTILLLCLLALAVSMTIHEQQVERLDEGKYTLQDATGKYLVDACFTCTSTEEEHLVVLQDIPQFSANVNL